MLFSSELNCWDAGWMSTRSTWTRNSTWIRSWGSARYAVKGWKLTYLGTFPRCSHNVISWRWIMSLSSTVRISWFDQACRFGPRWVAKGDIPWIGKNDLVYDSQFISALSKKIICIPFRCLPALWRRDAAGTFRIWWSQETWLSWLRQRQISKY